MAEAMRPGIGTHFLRYSVGGVLVMLAGFVSFPVMARLLDYAQFGLLGIFDSALLLLAALFKFGGQHAILRLYPHRGGAGAMASYGTNQILVPFLGSCVLWSLAMLALAFVPPFRRYARDATAWMALASLLPTIWISMLTALMVARERAGQRQQPLAECRGGPRHRLFPQPHCARRVRGASHGRVAGGNGADRVAA